MAKITYENKVALNENSEIADINKVKDTDMNQIKEAVNTNETKELLEVTNIAPDICSTGDMYFNTTDNLIYTATATNTWGSTGVAPTSNTIYVTFTDNTIYMYDGTTLVNVGGGAGGGGDNEPIGKVVPMALETAPDGYLLCDGSTYTKEAYPDLYKALRGTQFIVDTNSFNVPNIKGKVIVGKDSNDTDFDTIGETGGSKYLQEHTHRTASNLNLNSVGLSGNQVTSAVDYGSGTQLYTEGVYNQTTGNSGNLQPYIVLNYFIKAQKLSGDVVLSESLPVGTEVDFDGSASDIPVGWEEVATYSTNEVKTGDNWIDDKPIYRKCVNVTTALTPNNENVVGTIQNADSFVNIRGNGVLSNVYVVPFPYIDGTNNMILYCRKTSATNFNIVLVPASTNITNINVIIEYTKTTD